MATSWLDNQICVEMERRRFSKAKNVGLKGGRRKQRQRTTASNETKTEQEEVKEPALVVMSDVDIRKIEQHTENIMTGLEVMWRQGLLCDVTLSVGKTSFKVSSIYS